MNPTELEDAIRAAFPTLPVPSPEAAVSASNEACEECAALRESLAARPWDALDQRWLELHEADLLLLSGVGFRYYLPAFLLRAWRTPRAGSLVHLVANLDPRDPRDPARLDPWMLERLSPFRPEQRALIQAFLDAVASAPELDSIERARVAKAQDGWRALAVPG